MSTSRPPLFSLLVPTRDRPELVRYCLESLKRQTCPDFEVVVSDNAAARPCRAEFDRIADARFRYVAPPSPLSMPDNWEFVSQFATGRYVGVLIDKTVLMPSALASVAELLRSRPAELVSWWNDGYYPKDETAGYDVGAFYSAGQPRPPEAFDPGTELERRFSWDVRRGLEGRHYYWGKICFGLYHRDLVARIRSRLGRLFLPLSPDYTSMLAALGLADSALDVGRAYLVSFSSALSTGTATARDPAVARNYLRQNHPEVIENLPLPGLYASQHNLVAYDYVQLQRKLGGRIASVRLNLDNLILRAKEDLELQRWSDPREQAEQEAILAAHLSSVRAGVLAKYRLEAGSIRLRRSVLAARQRLHPWGSRFPRLKKFAKALLRESAAPAATEQRWQPRETFSSILEAAAASDRYYASRWQPTP
jgi:hypothetical protein